MTISDTFSHYNTLVVLYSAGPFSLIFTFRVFRTLTSKFISETQKKTILIVLIIIQYTTMVIIRNDTIRGILHYFFTVVTISLLLVYHYVVRDEYSNGLERIKPMTCVVGIVAIVGFATLLFCNFQTQIYLWGLTCAFEIVGISAISILDLIDVYHLGCKLNLD